MENFQYLGNFLLAQAHTLASAVIVWLQEAMLDAAITVTTMQYQHVALTTVQ